MKRFSHLKIEAFSDFHCQGIAIDKKREYMYFSFTTSIIKTDLNGNVIGSVKGIYGHLGCLAYNYEDGRLYASLEYNDDDIGMGILRKLNLTNELPNRFYIAIFDVDKITRADMDAEKDGIMTAVFLKEVTDDYNFPGHKYGCSGVDGITFSPKAGSNCGNYVYIAYGIYDDRKRKDNDYQILLRFDPSELKEYELPLSQNSLHINGPEKALDKYFILTGNTDYGIQNLEYDKENNCLFAAVYKGRKRRYPNYKLFAFDLRKVCEHTKLKGISEYAETLELKKFDFFKSRGKICGSDFTYGATGMISLGNGCFLFSDEFKENGKYGTDVYSYQLYNERGFIKEEILL